MNAIRIIPADLRLAKTLHDNAYDLTTLAQMLAEHRTYNARLQRYSIQDLEIGESILVPRRHGRYGRTDKTQSIMAARAYQENKRTGRRFTTQVVGDFVQVTRTE